MKLSRRQVGRLVALLRKVAGEIWDIGDPPSGEIWDIGDPPSGASGAPAQKNRLANLLDNAADKLERRLD